MAANVIKLADQSVVVFDKQAKEAYVFAAHVFTENNPSKALDAAREYVRKGQGVMLNKAQLEVLSAGLAQVALLG